MPLPLPTPSRCDFGPVTITYDDRVLAPRPWTLAHSEWAAELAKDTHGPLLELCAGAGHIGLAAAVLAERELVQVELDPVAAGFAVANATAAGRAERVEVRTAALDAALAPAERYALILADPPYLPSAALARWPADPPLAIDGGADGLDVVRACLHVAASHLTDDGVLLLQVAGLTQAVAVEAMVDAAPEWSLRVREVRVTDAERAVARLDRH